MTDRQPSQPARIRLWQVRSAAGPFHRRHDGLERRDGLYEQLFVTVQLRPGEEPLGSWPVKHPPPDKRLSLANEGTANLILTSRRLVYEPFVPPKFGGGPGLTTWIANLGQSKWRDSQRSDAFALELADLVDVEIPEVSWPRRAGAPLRIVTRDGHRLFQVWHRGLIAGLTFESAGARNRAARDAALQRIRAAMQGG